MPRRKKRLPKEAIQFIREANMPYTEIKDQIGLKWKIEVAKSAVSYYKRHRPRIKNVSLAEISTDDWNWFRGLFSADGNKIISKDRYGKHYIIRISLDKKRDLSVTEKCVRIVKEIGLSSTVFSEGNCLRVKISSKLLFNVLNKKPDESNITPAYIAGAIDGDG